MDATGWTLDELTARVADALDGPAYPGAPNGRVRDVPDARAIRWYATIGLVDRPLGMRGRTALYGPRHLLQLVAVKRRQAQGHRLADIQAELSGAPDEQLRRIAQLTAPASSEAPAGPSAGPSATASAAASAAASGEAPGTTSEAPADPEPRPKFWADRPDPAPHPPRTAVPESRDAAVPESRDAAVPLHGVRLADGVVLLLPAPPGPDDVAALAAAAEPLMDTLAARGLLVREESR
jgi:hypothetical protein